MKRTVLALTVACLAACDSAPVPSPRETPVPTGTVSAVIDDMRDGLFMLDACLGSQTALPATAELSLDVPDPADNDDQQRFTITLASHAHEDSVDCVREVILDWKDEP